jgi:hypothetical protein
MKTGESPLPCLAAEHLGHEPVHSRLASIGPTHMIGYCARHDRAITGDTNGKRPAINADKCSLLGDIRQKFRLVVDHRIAVHMNKIVTEQRVERRHINRSQSGMTPFLSIAYQIFIHPFYL